MSDMKLKDIAEHLNVSIVTVSNALSGKKGVSSSLRNSSRDNQIAAMCYIKWLVEESGFAQGEGGLSIVLGDEYPDALKTLEGVELVINNPADPGEENLYNDFNNDSELGLNVSGAVPKEIVEEALSGTKTMEEMTAEWNEKWTAAQESNGVTH